MGVLSSVDSSVIGPERDRGCRVPRRNGESEEANHE